MNAWVERRNIGLFLAGKAVSQSGSALYTFAAGWYVLAVTGSAATFGLTLALGILPMVLVMPLAGILADRLNRKRMVVGMDALNGMWFLAMGLYASVHGLTLGAVYATAVVTTVLTTLFSVSLESSKLALVTEAKLMSLNASSRVVESVVSVAGPVFGGLVYAWIGMEAFLWINGVSFLLSALTESWMRYEGPGGDLGLVSDNMDSGLRTVHNLISEGPKQKVSLWRTLRREFGEGLSAVWTDSVMRSLAWRLMAINFFIGFCVSVPLPYVLHRALEGGEKVLGVVQGATPVGVILGAILLGWLKWGVDRAMKVAGVLLASSFVVLGGLMGFMEWQLVNIGTSVAEPLMSITWMGLIPGMLLLGIGIAWIDLPLMYHFQLVVPEHLKGRVLSVVMSLAKLVLPVALLGAGVLMGQVPAGLLTLVGGVFYLLTLLKDWRKKAFETGNGREGVEM
ncbi:MFS transporter [Acidaminobacter sp.]|uniref:MFS transporter n=1 Tax=Acidaminobacter sp. TaxID=1872102 RepID=UPI001382FEEA|nr:MFS transporter [Acidaminobacter sp.]MDK9710150.1 MFS transporter [Acidaminobacter sp.]MZQ98764.1 MFS transporter [Acidaminobacter sp.]